MERVYNKHHGGKTSVCSIFLRVSIVILLLAVGVGFEIGVPRQQAYAKSMCGILFSCPTPTPGPTATPRPAPTPTPFVPTPSPTPPPQLSPTAVSGSGLEPTATVSVTPTPIATSAATQSASPTRVAQKTPVPASTHNPGVTDNQQSDNHTANQPEENGFSRMLMIIGFIFCVLFSILGIGLLIFRRMLLPPIKVKLPSSGVTSWTRTIASDSFNGMERSDDIQDAQPINSVSPAFASMDNNVGTIVDSLVSSPSVLLSNTASVVVANDDTTPNIAAYNANNPWYDVSDEPFTT